MRWFFAWFVIGLAATGCESSGSTGGNGGGPTTGPGAGTTSPAGTGGGSQSTSTNSGASTPTSTTATGSTTNSGTSTSTSTASAGGGGGASSGTSGTGGGPVVGYGCDCQDTQNSTDCPQGLICFAFGMGPKCTALCSGGVCPLTGGDDCNNMSPAACKPPDAPVCGAATTTGVGGSGGGGGATSTASGTGGTTGAGGGGTGGSSGGTVPYDGCCTGNEDCQSGLICGSFNSKGHRCTGDCSTDPTVCDQFSNSRCGGNGLTCTVPGTGTCP